jgi:hypothetical protein
MSDQKYTLGGMYGFQTLSRVLESDAHEASQLGMSDVENKLSDLARHAAELEEQLERDIVTEQELIDVKGSLELELEDAKAGLLREITDHTEACKRKRELEGRLSAQKSYCQILSEALENFVSGSDIQRQAALMALDEYNKGIDQAARDEVESELHEAGIIEDPDVDGGLLG